MRVAVTGGSGQLGTLFLRRCVAARAIEHVTVLDLVPPAVPSPKLEFVRADVRDPDIGRHFEGCDAVVHLAFLIFGHVHRETYDSVNVFGSQNVFRAALAAGVGHLVYASSIAAYGVVPGHPTPITESTPRRLDPKLAYSANKFEVEAFLDELEREQPDLVVTRLRPSVLVGRRMEHALGKLMRRGYFLNAGGPPPPLVWDDDVAAALMLALERRAHGAFILTAEEPLHAPELAEAAGLRLIPLPSGLTSAGIGLLETLARVGLRGPLDPNWLRAGRVPMLVSAQKARAELGWRPRCATCREVGERFAREALGRPSPRVGLFMRLTDLAARFAPPRADARHAHLRIHLELYGPGGGDFTLAVDEGHVRVTPGLPRPNDASLSLRTRDFIRLLTGDLEWAAADLAGTVRLFGEPVAKRVLAGLVTTFRTRQQQGGAGAFAARRLSRWLAAEVAS